MGGCSSVDLKVTQEISPALNHNEINLIRTSWRPIVEYGLSKTGANMMMRLFTRYPELKQLYSFAKNLENNNQSISSELLINHGRKLFSAIDLAISSLDNMNSLIPILIQLGFNHRKWDVKEEHFEIIGGVLLETLQDSLQDQFTPKVEQAWLKFFNTVSIYMKFGLTQLNNS